MYEPFTAQLFWCNGNKDAVIDAHSVENSDRKGWFRDVMAELVYEVMSEETGSWELRERFEVEVTVWCTSIADLAEVYHFLGKLYDMLRDTYPRVFDPDDLVVRIV